MSDSLRLHGLVHGILQARILEWVAFLSPGNLPNPRLPHCRQILYQLSHKRSPRILEWVAYPFSRGSSWLRDRTGVACIAGRFFTKGAIREAQKEMFNLFCLYLWLNQIIFLKFTSRREWYCLHVESKGKMMKKNQRWIFTGRTYAEAETPILWPPDAKSQLIGKDPDTGKDWRQEENGVT